MPITPVFEQPPVTARRTGGIDWTEVLAALTEHPDEWARVDGPFPNDKKGHSNAGNHGKSLRTWADRADTQVETRKAVKDDEVWVYARTVDDAAPTPAPAPTPAKKPPVAAVPNPNPATPNAGGDFDGGDHHCDTCGAEFRTNTRLRQHQANAHRAS